MAKLIYARIGPVTDSLLTQEQAGFRCGRSTVDQVTLLTQKIEDSFSAKKTGAVFVDPTAAYDTVRDRGVICKKLLRLLPDKHMVSFIMELARNRSFTLITGNGSQSRLQRLRNGVPQGLVLAPFLFNIYTYDLTTTTSKKLAYAARLGDPALHRRLENIRGDSHPGHENAILVFPQLEAEAQRKQNSHSSLPPLQQGARRDFAINVEGRALPFSTTPTYLGVKLDRTHTFCQHLD